MGVIACCTNIKQRELKGDMSKRAYTIKKINPGWVKKGQHLSPATEIKKSQQTLSYSGLHSWVKRNLGKPNKCSKCGLTSDNPRQIQWSNISGEYHQDLADWQRLCAKCHAIFDRGIATHCSKGHEYTAENTRLRRPGCGRGERVCVECQRGYLRAFRKRSKEKVSD